MIWLLVFIQLFVPSCYSCQCAPLASCVVYSNGSWGCVCPFFGDGFNTCDEQRFVTDVIVRSKSELNPWLGHLTQAKVGLMTQRKLLSETQYILELDSTNYDAMLSLTEQINQKNWPFQVALLGSATSRVVMPGNYEEESPLLEVTNITYNNTWWEIEVVASQGMVFVASETAPLPCIHTRSSCCALDYAYRPFRVGILDISPLTQCKIPQTNQSQALGTMNSILVSNIVYHGDNLITIKIADQELQAISSNQSTFSVGLIDSNQAATQVQISLTRDHFFTNYSIGNFTRQVAPFIMMQVEQVNDKFYMRCWAQITLPNATIAFLQYSWGDMDWMIPLCNTPPPASCFQVPTLCQPHFTNQLMELWVPIQNHRVDMGNLSLYMVLQSNTTLARVMTQSKPTVAVQHCTQITLSDSVDVQILQGLQLRQIYRGAVLPYMHLDIEPQTDTLITLIARSTRGAAIEQLRAVHARTQDERTQIEAGLPCETCVTEQLILNAKVTSARSCFLFGAGDESTWIQNYVGLVGSTLALDILTRVPQDVKTGTAAAAWINPVWPYSTDEEIKATTYLYAKFAQPKTQGVNLRKLLSFQTNSQGRIKAQWIMIATAAFAVMLWSLYLVWTLK